MKSFNNLKLSTCILLVCRAGTMVPRTATADRNHAAGNGKKALGDQPFRREMRELLQEAVHAVLAHDKPVTSYADIRELLQSNLVLRCARSACGTALDATRGFVRIYNVPSEVNGRRNYCVRCARRIIEAGWMRNEVYDPKIYGWREWIKNPQEPHGNNVVSAASA